MAKKSYERSKEQRRMLDSDLKAVKYLSIPVFGVDGPTLNDNEDEAGPIGITDTKRFVYYDGEQWIEVGRQAIEEISFATPAGAITIDFNISDRLAHFGENPTVLAFQLDGTNKIFIKDFGVSFNTATKVLTLDGFFIATTIVLKP